MNSEKYIYKFEEGNAKMVPKLGGKGANLAEMTSMGFSVPPGFTITTDIARIYSEKGDLPEGLLEEVKKHVEMLEEVTGKGFGSQEDPLLVSVRSGAPVSMPGMMDTVLNVGLNDKIIERFAKLTSERFAYDSYRRLIQMFGNIVKEIKRTKFEDMIQKVKGEYKIESDAELPVEGLKKLVDEFKKIYKEETGEAFPQDPMKQLWEAIKAVFESWNNPQAIKYRELHGLSHDLGTACNVQMMVFGNYGWNSATGVGFTRNPSTGKKRLYGEYLKNAQGEDVVGGIRTPKDIHELKEDMPEIYKELEKIAGKLEEHYEKVQDFEFTIQDGKFWLLQTRTGKRTAKAHIKFAVDFAEEGLIKKDEAVMRIDPEHIRRILHKQIDPEVKENVSPLTKGINASPGSASGRVVFNPDEAEKLREDGWQIILVRPETAPEDFGGMAAANGILTSRGGTTSHAAIVARSIGKPAVVGAGEIQIDLEHEKFTVNTTTIEKGQWITIDGTDGTVYTEKLKTVKPGLFPEAQKILSWGDTYRTLGVRSNAEREKNIEKAINFGAEGIGLARTEYLFMGKRTQLVQDIVLSKTTEERKKVLEELVPQQRKDFKEMLGVTDKKVMIRLLDAPFHEFFPNYEELLEEVAVLRERKPNSQELQEKEKILNALEKIRDTNPMLGFRVCRLGIVYPEVYRAQARAALEAAAELINEGKKPNLAIMIPGVAHWKELKILREEIEAVAKKVEEEYGVEIPYEIGTMIETPRSALTADQITKVADFLSFGTNDMTQMTYGMSRDDAERNFMAPYIEKGIFDENPFQVLDADGVGELMRIGVTKAKKTDPDIEVGICGEHGGESASIRLSNEIGLDYVSCSPYRVPVARLVTAQIGIKKKWEETGYEPKDIGY
ncbi:MAG: pyruvate, phosphate dikinase [Candidatus Korarchaeota archaeon]|nr:pyruvate, phosphate dikinase [Candidatus Korarchaeota archaeon]NIU82824.1 pyruvate, phosphate dikinase [Candidatus Thorarchaeota archaeon]NIW13310.1 pyruvate, phosphate dikinase [Candidatus Thorarchaeota archaeon]NIW51416.1 pyruvate, phosphate dikinase [Candidatus Korarchaeota archaeon]